MLSLCSEPTPSRIQSSQAGLLAFMLEVDIQGAHSRLSEIVVAPPLHAVGRASRREHNVRALLLDARYVHKVRPVHTRADFLIAGGEVILRGLRPVVPVTVLALQEL